MQTAEVNGGMPIQPKAALRAAMHEQVRLARRALAVERQAAKAATREAKAIARRQNNQAVQPARGCKAVAEVELAESVPETAAMMSTVPKTKALPEPFTITLRDAAIRTGLSTSNLHRLIQTSSEIRTFKVGRCRLILWASLQNFITQNPVQISRQNNCADIQSFFEQGKL